MADWNADVTPTQGYVALLALLAARDVDAVTLGKAAFTNPPNGAIEYNRAGFKFREWTGAAYADILVSIAGGGTGASTASGARTALGLGTIAIQNANAVAITGGTVAADLTGSTNLNATALSTGTVPSARLGSGGLGTGTKALFDDQTFKVITANLRDQIIVVAAVQAADFVADFTKDVYPLSSAAAHTVTLPTVVGNGGKRIGFVNRNTGIWSFQCNGAETLLGSNLRAMDFGQYSSFTLEADANSGLWDVL